MPQSGPPFVARFPPEAARQGARGHIDRTAFTQNQGEEPKSGADIPESLAKPKTIRAWWHGHPVFEEKALDRFFFRHTWRAWDGAMAGKDPLWGTPNLAVNKPKDYPHITSLDNDDPSSFWYTLRPNLLNVPVADEWDWLSMINTERSDFTDLTYTVGKGVSYLEEGWTYQHVTSPNTSVSQRSLPETLLRYGVTDELEIRLFWQGYILLAERDNASGAQLNNFGAADVDPQIKYELWQQHNWIPMNVIIVGALIPSGTRGFSGDRVQPHWGMIQGWGIKRWLYLKHESGLNYLTQPTFNAQGFGNPGNIANAQTIFVAQRFPATYQWHESVSLIYHAAKHFGGFNEWFYLFGKNQTQEHFFDTGIFIYPTPNVQFDAVFGIRLNDPRGVHQYFMKAGFATRW